MDISIIETVLTISGLSEERRRKYIEGYLQGVALCFIIVLAEELSDMKIDYKVADFLKYLEEYKDSFSSLDFANDDPIDNFHNKAEEFMRKIPENVRISLESKLQIKIKDYDLKVSREIMSSLTNEKREEIRLAMAQLVDS